MRIIKGKVRTGTVYLPELFGRNYCWETDSAVYLTDNMQNYSRSLRILGVTLTQINNIGVRAHLSRPIPKNSLDKLIEILNKPLIKITTLKHNNTSIPQTTAVIQIDEWDRYHL